MEPVRDDPPADRSAGPSPSRRRYLVVGASLLVAGCSGSPGETGTETSEDGSVADADGTTDPTPTSGATATDGPTVERGITYRETADGPLALDVVRPAGAESAPGVVFAHGGGWARGRRGQFEPHARKLAAEGYASVLVGYRLSGTASFPAPVEDLAAALAWTRANADRVGVDPERLAVGGGSAGGHLAALVATSPDAFAPEGSLAPPAALAGFNGVYDLTTEGMRSAGLVEQFVGASYDEAAEQYRAASPVEQVDGRDPPALLLHGTADRVVPYGQATAFRDALSAAGVDASLYTAEDARHGFHNDEPWLSRTTDRLTAFLDERV